MEKILDINGKQIEIGQTVIVSCSWGRNNSRLQISEIIGFTPKMIRLNTKTKSYYNKNKTFKSASTHQIMIL